MSDIGFIFSLLSDAFPDFRNIWYSPIIPYNLIGVYRVEQIMEISDFTRKRAGIHKYLENNVNIQNEFLKVSVQQAVSVLNKIGNNRKNMDMRSVIICKICHKPYKTKTGYKSHLATTNSCFPSNKGYSCIFCNQLFASISNVRKHTQYCELSIKNHVYVTKLNKK